VRYTSPLAAYGHWLVVRGAALFAGKKDRVFGAEAEGNFILPETGLVIGLRVEPEFGARNRTQGLTFMLSAANELASLVKQH
jgi:hypothetical protein